MVKSCPHCGDKPLKIKVSTDNNWKDWVCVKCGGYIRPFND